MSVPLPLDDLSPGGFPSDGSPAKHSPADDSRPKGPASRVLRAVVHAAIGYHLFAIVIAPATIPPSSQLQRTAFLGAERYLRALNLNNGYHYFAPDPGESRLIEYAGTDADGTRVAGRLPDRRTQPRLLYHRYFMLTESQPTPDDTSAEAVAHRAALRQGVARHTGLADLELSTLTHRLATPQLIRAGFTLGDDGQYDRQPLEPAALPTLPMPTLPVPKPLAPTPPDAIASEPIEPEPIEPEPTLPPPVEVTP